MEKPIRQLGEVYSLHDVIRLAMPVFYGSREVIPAGAGPGAASGSSGEILMSDAR
jgi:hypothetical protein